MKEYTIRPHGQQHGTDSFFQSHHGVQGAWAIERKIPGYVYDEQPTILVRDSRKGTPHEIINSLQKERAGDLAGSTYANERENMMNDLDQAGVPKDVAEDLRKQTDAYFGKLYEAARANLTPRGSREPVRRLETETMTTPSFLGRLRALDSSRFSHGPPARPEKLAELERLVGHSLPEDFRASALAFGAWMVKGPRFTIGVELIDDILMIMRDEDWSKDLPGMALIGSDGGDCWYYYDPLDKLGHGEFAVYLVDRGVMTLARSMYIAKTLAEATECVLAGEMLYDRPYLSP